MLPATKENKPTDDASFPAALSRPRSFFFIHLRCQPPSTSSRESTTPAILLPFKSTLTRTRNPPASLTGRQQSTATSHQTLILHYGGDRPTRHSTVLFFRSQRPVFRLPSEVGHTHTLPHACQLEPAGFCQRQLSVRSVPGPRHTAERVIQTRVTRSRPPESRRPNTRASLTSHIAAAPHNPHCIARH